MVSVARIRLDPGNLCGFPKGYFATTFLSSSLTCPATQSGLCGEEVAPAPRHDCAIEDGFRDKAARHDRATGLTPARLPRRVQATGPQSKRSTPLSRRKPMASHGRGILPIAFACDTLSSDASAETGQPLAIGGVARK